MNKKNDWWPDLGGWLVHQSSARKIRGLVELIVAPVDLRSFEAIEAFARSLGNILQREQPSAGHIDVLVNCAGMAGPVESMFAVNFLGTAKLTCLLRPLMNEKGGRVIFTASDAHQIGEIRFDDFNLQQRWGCVRPSITSFIDVQRAYASTKLTLISTQNFSHLIVVSLLGSSVTSIK